jgi:hypothetical protein
MPSANWYFVREVMQSRGVRRKLDDVRDRIAAGSGGEKEDGTRPKGRPYSRVFTQDGSGEFGTSTTPRRRTLGLASARARRSRS